MPLNTKGETNSLVGGGGVSELSSQEVTTFAESNITITHNSTVVNSGSVELGQGLADGTTLSQDPSKYSDNSSNDIRRGMVISPNTGLDGVKATVYSDVTAQDAQLFELGSPNNLLDTTTIDSGVIELSATLSAGTEYVISMSNEDSGGDFTYYYNFDVSPAQSGSDFDITNGYDVDGTFDAALLYTDITARIGSSATSGDTLVEFDSIPSELSEWGYVEFDRTLDNETAQVDVELDDGTVIAQDVGQHFPLAPIITDKNVRLRLNLSRSDANNNPTVDSLTRHYRK